jgi:DNA-binding GntR family transcriptional regulator
MVDPIPLHSPSLHDNVAARLRQLIFERQLAPGEFIDELALAARWEISRTPLREALKVLASEGLVEAIPRRGSRVVTMTDADAEQLFPVMALLEGRCAHEAVRRATPHDVAELRRLHDVLERHAARPRVTCAASCVCGVGASWPCPAASAPPSMNIGC